MIKYFFLVIYVGYVEEVVVKYLYLRMVFYLIMLNFGCKVVLNFL